MGYYKIDARERYEDEVRKIFDTLSQWVVSGVINPEATAVFALENMRDAFAVIQRRDHIGHVALVMNEAVMNEAAL